MINPVEIIEKKRDGHPLSEEEIRFMIHGYVKGEIPDYQMSAFLMTIYFQGMNEEETVALTKAFIDSGKTIDLSAISHFKVDKHSTGGVGDKISLILAPLVASVGIPVPMMAGRGLGHTGGTLDKLESIPGFSTQLSERAFREQIQRIGCAIMGQTEEIVPADRKIYALRDVTGTVPSLPLICSSIISKKKAEGTDGLVLDVKAGKGAFLKTESQAQALAKALVSLGNQMGIQTTALLTRMDQPLGHQIGNWLEVKESIQALQNQGPKDVMTVTLALGILMVMMAKKVKSEKEAHALLKTALETGSAYQKFLELVKAQGGDISVIEEPEKYPSPPRIEIESPKEGYIVELDAYQLGMLSVFLGAGRFRKEDSIDPGAGITLFKKMGEKVQKGELLAYCYTRRPIEEREIKQRFWNAYQFSETPGKILPLIHAQVDKNGIHPFLMDIEHL